jgi:hypothetical protein
MMGQVRARSPDDKLLGAVRELERTSHVQKTLAVTALLISALGAGLGVYRQSAILFPGLFLLTAAVTGLVALVGWRRVTRRQTALTALIVTGRAAADAGLLARAYRLLVETGARDVDQIEGVQQLVNAGANTDTAALLRPERRGHVVAGLSILSLVALVACGAYILAAASKARREQWLESWNLPRDLYQRQGLLDTMALAGDVTNVNWIGNNIRHLDLRGSRVTDLRELPTQLETLDISDVPVGSLEGLPDSLRVLKIGFNSNLRTLRGLPSGLTSLSVGATAALSLRDLPTSLRTLELSDSSLMSVDGLPAGLQSLTLNGTQVISLKGLPESLTELRLLDNLQLRLKDYIPESLSTLEIDRIAPANMPRWSELPRSLRHLSLHRVAVQNLAGLPDLESLAIAAIDPSLSLTRDSWSQLPNSLTTISLTGPTGLPRTLPRSIKMLSSDIEQNLLENHVDARVLMAPASKDVLEELLRRAVHLTALRVMFPRFDSLPRLPQGLKSLRLDSAAMSDLTSLADLLEIEHLEIRSNHRLVRIQSLPQSLVTLDLANADNLREIGNLPPNLRCLNLHGARSLQSLPILPSSLRAIDLTDTKFALNSVADNLGHTQLVMIAVSPGRVASLARLPTTVRELDFRASDDFCRREEERGHFQ